MDSHNKSVDSPLAHRSLKRNPQADPQSDNTFHIGAGGQHQEPSWQQTQRYQARQGDHEGLLRHDAGAASVRPSSSHRDRKQFDHAGNADWTQNTQGSTVQKVLQEAGSVQRLDRGDEWNSSSCAKVITGDSPKRGMVIERDDKTIPNEIPRRDPNAFIAGWGSESMKTVDQEKKKPLDLAPKPAPRTPPKSTGRPEDWDSNLKTLPNCSRTGERKPHVYEDIKDSVVAQPQRSPVRQF